MKFSVMVIVMLLGSISATLARDKLILASGEKVKGVIVVLKKMVKSKFTNLLK